MVSISLFIELLRTRPRLLFLLVAVLQTLLWTVVPVLFYAAPPGELPLVLAVGHEWRAGTEFGPPLAFWIAEAAFRLGGMPAVYLLSQLCIVATYWAVLALGRAIVGEAPAVMAVLLMAGIAVFSVPTPEFGPAILATPLWALLLLHLWRGAERGELRYWLAAGLEAGLLLLTSYAGLVLIALVVLYLVLSAFGRTLLGTVGPWVAGIVAVVVLFPFLIWLDRSGGLDFLGPGAIVRNLRAYGWLVAALLVGHAGLLILVVLGRGLIVGSRGHCPEVTALPVDRAARRFVYFFALAPVVAMTLFALYSRRPENLVAAPLAVLSGLAIIVAAGERIKIAHQYVIGYAWAALLLLPPLLVAFAIATQGWIVAADLRVGQPAAEMGRFFGESFERRTGQPLQIVAGDRRLAALVALAAQSRPSLYFDPAAGYRPLVTREQIEDKGAVVVWRATDSAGRPPPAVAAQFPNLVTEVPRAFSRPYEGRMALTRIGWGMIRPHSQDGAAQPATPATASPAQPTPQPLPSLPVPEPPPPPAPQLQAPPPQTAQPPERPVERPRPEREHREREREREPQPPPRVRPFFPQPAPPL